MSKYRIIEDGGGLFQIEFLLECGEWYRPKEGRRYHHLEAARKHRAFLEEKDRQITNRQATRRIVE